MTCILKCVILINKDILCNHSLSIKGRKLTVVYHRCLIVRSHSIFSTLPTRSSIARDVMVHFIRISFLSSLTLDLFLSFPRFSWSLYFWKLQASYVVESPSVWVHQSSLMTRFRLRIFSRSITEAVSCSYYVLLGDTLFWFVPLVISSLSWIIQGGFSFLKFWWFCQVFPFSNFPFAIN